MRPIDKKWKIGFGYGEKYPPELQKILKIKYHKGVDYFCPNGASVLCPVFGVISEVGENKYKGKYIIIRFDILQGLSKSIYRFIAMHLSKILITEISPIVKVSKGSIIAKTGDTGTFYDGRLHPHCHCQIDKFDKGRKIWTDIDHTFIFGKV